MTAPVPADLTARVQGVFAIPLHRFLSIELLDPRDPAAGLVLPVEEPVLNNAGVLHGGIVTALLDVACYLALLPRLADGQNAVTHDVAASLMRPVAAGSRLEIVGDVIRLGRAVAFLRAEARVDGVVVGTGQVTKTVVAPRLDDQRRR
jgi:uncharacterized protein (TIGR00369 family)